MRFAPLLIAAILPALVTLSAHAAPAATSEPAKAPTHAKAKEHPRHRHAHHVRAKTHAHAKAHAKRKAQHHVAKTTEEKTPGEAQAKQSDLNDKIDKTALPQTSQAPAADATTTPATPEAASPPQQPQAQPIDPKLVAKALALVKAKTQAEAQAPQTSDTPAVDTSLMDRAGASFHKVSESLQNTLDDALSLIGIRYRRGGTSPETGFDCSGFVVHVFREGMGLILPRTARELSRVGVSVKKKDLQPGDLVFFNTMRRTFSHVGIYLGNGQFIHAPHTGSEVRVESMRESYWVKRYEGARRMEISE